MRRDRRADRVRVRLRHDELFSAGDDQSAQHGRRPHERGRLESGLAGDTAVYFLGCAHRQRGHRAPAGRRARERSSVTTAAASTSCSSVRCTWCRASPDRKLPTWRRSRRSYFPRWRSAVSNPSEMIALLATSGAMAETIPPSLVLIIIGTVAGVSIRDLFTDRFVAGGRRVGRLAHRGAAPFAQRSLRTREAAHRVVYRQSILCGHSRPGLAAGDPLLRRFRALRRRPRFQRSESSIRCSSGSSSIASSIGSARIRCCARPPA